MHADQQRREGVLDHANVRSGFYRSPAIVSAELSTAGSLISQSCRQSIEVSGLKCESKCA